MKKDNNQNKEDFIKKLSSMSIIEINQYIKEKGKPRKMIIPIIMQNSKL